MPPFLKPEGLKAAGPQGSKASNEHRFVKSRPPYHNLIKGVGRGPAAGRAVGQATGRPRRDVPALAHPSRHDRDRPAIARDRTKAR
jgi:hypothetical protein